VLTEQPEKATIERASRIIKAYLGETTAISEERPEQKGQQENIAKSAKFSGTGKNPQSVLGTPEGQPKKQAFASHGDFQQYLYEAPIFSMPVCHASDERALIRAVLVLGAEFGVFNLVFWPKFYAVSLLFIFRSKTI
jgi:hypothetical protein